MKKLLSVALVALTVGMFGCASMDSSGRSSSVQGREVLFGMNAKETGALVGGVAGAAVTQNASGPVQALAIIGGALGGGLFGDRFDESARRAGRTDCTWRYSGTVDPDGTPHQSSGYYDCRGGNSTVGNRNYPPRATPQ